MHTRFALSVALPAVAILGISACAGDPAAAPPAPITTWTSPSVSPTPSVVATTELPAPKLGDKQESALGDLTVYAIKFPVKPQDSTASRIKTAGTQFAIADIKACSNGTVDDDGYGPDASNFFLRDTQDSTYGYWNVQIGARSPNLTDSLVGSDQPRKGSCKRGWLTFEVPPGTRIKAVDYTSSSSSLTWLAR